MNKRMMTFLAAGLSLSLLFVPRAARAEWATGVVVNPLLGGLVLESPVATSDQSSVGFCVDVAASAAAVFRIQHRDADNASTLHEQYLPVPALGVAHFCQANGEFNLLTGERIRIIVSAAVVGTVSASIQDSIY